MHTSTVVIGAGRVGRTVAARLAGRAAARPRRAGRPVGLRAAADRHPRCRDRAGLPAAGAAAAGDRGGRPLLGRHLGARARRGAGGPIACVHPLQTVWPERGPDQLEGAYAAVTGDRTVGERLARDLGMTPFSLADEAEAALPRRLGVRLELPGHDDPGGGRPAGALRARPRAGAAGAAAAAAAHAGGGGAAADRADRARRRRHRGRPPGGDRPRAGAALPGARAGDAAAGGAGRRPLPWSRCCEHGPGADHGRAARRTPRAAARRPGRERPCRDEPVREPHPVRPRARTSSAIRATSSATARSPPRRASTRCSRPPVEEMYPPGFATSVAVGGPAEAARGQPPGPGTSPAWPPWC